MKSGREGMVVGYNAQNAVDEKYQLIVHHELTQAGSDNQQLKPMFQESREAVVGELEMVVVDAGYSNGEQISDLQSSEYDVAVPSNRGDEQLGLANISRKVTLPICRKKTLTAVLLESYCTTRLQATRAGCVCMPTLVATNARYNTSAARQTAAGSYATLTKRP